MDIHDQSKTKPILEITCNGEEVKNFSFVTTPGELNCMLRILKGEVPDEVPPLVFMLHQSFRCEGQGGVLLSKCENGFWNFKQKLFVFHSSAQDKVSFFIFHPTIGLRILTVDVLDNTSGYFFIPPSYLPQFQSAAYATIFEFDSVEKTSFIKVGSRIPVIVRCKRMKDMEWVYDKAPDCPSLAIRIHNYKAESNIDFPAVWSSIDEFLLPFTYKGGGSYLVSNFSLGKLPPGEYMLGVRMPRSDSYFGHIDIHIITKDDEKNIVQEFKNLVKELRESS